MTRDAFEYEDIIDMPHPVSARHRPMPPDKRAAQFAPFAALTGYEQIVLETARLTDEQIVLGEDERRRLDTVIAFLCAFEGSSSAPAMEVEYFIRDEKKSGGRYATARGRLFRINADDRTVELEGCDTINLDLVVDIRGKFEAVLDRFGDI